MDPDMSLLTSGCDLNISAILTNATIKKQYKLLMKKVKSLQKSKSTIQLLQNCLVQEIMLNTIKVRACLNKNTSHDGKKQWHLKLKILSLDLMRISIDKMMTRINKLSKEADDEQTKFLELIPTVVHAAFRKFQIYKAQIWFGRERDKNSKKIRWLDKTRTSEIPPNSPPNNVQPPSRRRNRRFVKRHVYVKEKIKRNSRPITLFKNFSSVTFDEDVPVDPCCL